jgi:hypothetical protein
MMRKETTAATLLMVTSERKTGLATNRTKLAKKVAGAHTFNFLTRGHVPMTTRVDVDAIIVTSTS